MLFSRRGYRPALSKVQRIPFSMLDNEHWICLRVLFIIIPLLSESILPHSDYGKSQRVSSLISDTDQRESWVCGCFISLLLLPVMSHSEGRYSLREWSLLQTLQVRASSVLVQMRAVSHPTTQTAAFATCRYLIPHLYLFHICITGRPRGLSQFGAHRGKCCTNL